MAVRKGILNPDFGYLVPAWGWWSLSLNPLSFFGNKRASISQSGAEARPDPPAAPHGGLDHGAGHPCCQGEKSEGDVKIQKAALIHPEDHAH